jgi:transcriptional regulator GlxA family with amidase domain
MAKVGSVALPKGEKPSEAEDKAAYGRVLRVVQHVLGKSRKEMAALLGVDERQLGRWYDGVETAQMWRYHRDLKVRRALRLIEAIDDVDGATVETTIRSRLDLTQEQ